MKLGQLIESFGLELKDYSDRNLNKEVVCQFYTDTYEINDVSFDYENDTVVIRLEKDDKGF